MSNQVKDKKFDFFPCNFEKCKFNYSKIFRASIEMTAKKSMKTLIQELCDKHTKKRYTCIKVSNKKLRWLRKCAFLSVYSTGWYSEQCTRKFHVIICISALHSFWSSVPAINIDSNIRLSTHNTSDRSKQCEPHRTTFVYSRFFSMWIRHIVGCTHSSE